MKSITFSENELEIILKLYKSELDEVENYVGRIKGTLVKLKATKPATVETTLIEEVKIKKKKGRKPGKKAEVEKPAPKKRGRKPKTSSAELKAVTEGLIAEAQKKVGRKTKTDGSAPKKRGRKPKAARAALKSLPETSDTKFGLDDSKRGKKKIKKRSRRKRGTPIFGKKVLLAPLAKQVQLKEELMEVEKVEGHEDNVAAPSMDQSEIEVKD